MVSKHPPDERDHHTERADWERRWPETGYDSLEDALHNVSHVGDPKTDYEWVTEPDDHSPTSAEAVRNRRTGEWSEPDSLY